MIAWPRLKGREHHQTIHFDLVNKATFSALPALLARWLASGRGAGREYVVRNPRRADRALGIKIGRARRITVESIHRLIEPRLAAGSRGRRR